LQSASYPNDSEFLKRDLRLIVHRAKATKVPAYERNWKETLQTISDVYLPHISRFNLAFRKKDARKLETVKVRYISVFSETCYHKQSSIESKLSLETVSFDLILQGKQVVLTFASESEKKQEITI
jgi:hypothetical protein